MLFQKALTGRVTNTPPFKSEDRVTNTPPINPLKTSGRVVNTPPFKSGENYLFTPHDEVKVGRRTSNRSGSGGEVEELKIANK